MEGRREGFSGRGLACVVLAVIAVTGGLIIWSVPARGHSGDAIDSIWATSPPTVDGTMSPGEWSSAAFVNLTAIPGNELPAYLMIMNDGTFLWVAYDAVGDRTTAGNDSASFALDTSHDGVGTDGGEDQFVLSGAFAGGSAHLVYSGGSYFVEDSPFDPGLPNHAGLAGAKGYGPSDLAPYSHEIYEFQIPLVLIGASVGDTVGLFGGSQPVPGVLDYGSGYAYSTWPDFVGGPIPISQYGDLNLAFLPGPIGVVLSPSTASTNGAPGETVWYNLTALNTGTSVNDTFDLTIASSWPASLWASGGAGSLPDTDGDGTPDTGNLTSGSRAGFVVKVDIPSSGAGCDVATVTARSSWNVSISDSSALTSCIGPAVFAPPHNDRGIDLNGNGLLDVLRVDASIVVSQSDFYYVNGELYSGNGSVSITSAFASFSGSPGPWTASLDFDGRAIFTSGIDGPYLVELRLFDSFGRLIDTDDYVTGAYAAADFEAPPAAFSPPHSDQGVDTDRPPNGFFDELRLNVSLAVGVAGTYTIESYAFDSQGNFVTAVSNSFSLATGNPFVTIVFPGDPFYRALADGPYTIELLLYDSFRSVLDIDVYVTGPYLRSDFDPPPIVFAPPHSDRGVDTDVPPDGLFDWLAVSANVAVSEAGNYSVQGDLFGPGGFPYIATATATASLGIGPAAVDLQFSGPLIRRGQSSGNYFVSLSAGPAGTNGTTVFDFYTTRFYDFTQFQPPPGLLSPPHTDRGIDASSPPDGLYDWLEVGVGIDVSRASRFTIEGSLYGLGGLIGFSRATADLPIGRSSVPLQFDGHAIQLSGFGGPYFVGITLHDAVGSLIDFGSYVTGTYPISAFQTPDASLPTSAASVAGGYWKNGPVRVAFSASDPSPSDGLASVELYYRYSPNNATWFAWTRFDGRSVTTPGVATASGSFLFDLPAGEGYYQFYTVATDRAGGTEAAPASPDGAIGAFVPAQIELTPGTDSMVAGSARTFQARVRSASGTAVVLESPLTVALVTDSSDGEFRAVGTTTAINAIVIPAGASEGSFDYYDTLARTATITAASARAAPDSSVLTVTPAAVAAISVSPGAGGLAVGSSMTLTAAARDAYGNVVPNPTISWSIEGPGSVSGTSGTSVDLTVTGPGFVHVTATSGTTSATSTISGIATGGGDGGAASSSLVAGLGGGTVVGLLVGIAIGWFLTRRSKGREAAPPPPQSPPPPPPT